MHLFDDLRVCLDLLDESVFGGNVGSGAVEVGRHRAEFLLVRVEQAQRPARLHLESAQLLVALLDLLSVLLVLELQHVDVQLAQERLAPLLFLRHVRRRNYKQLHR